MIADMDQGSGPTPPKRPKKGSKAKDEPGIEEGPPCDKCERLDEITAKLWRVHPNRAQIAAAFHHWLDEGSVVVVRFDRESGFSAWALPPGSWEW